MSKFQTILLLIFGIIIVFAVLIFALSKSGFGGKEVRGQSIVWGVMDTGVMGNVLNTIKTSGDSELNIRYVEKRPESFATDFIEALASGIGPDAVIIPSDLLVRFEDKLLVLPQSSFSERQFKDSFVEGGEIFLGNSGVIGFPLVVDPLVMYWNRDIFSSAGVTEPPRFWEDVVLLSDKFSKRDPKGALMSSAVAFGEWRNVKNAKDILAMLFIQAGTNIVEKDGVGYDMTLDERNQSVSLPAESALRFYTDFANPLKTNYSWNRGMPSSDKVFVSGDSALYFGFASEIFDIRNKNPNLNFDVLTVPQTKGTDIKKTFGRVYGISVVKSSKDISSALLNAVSLSGYSSASLLSKSFGLPSVRRDILSTRPENAALETFYGSAKIARSWYDPNPEKTDPVFQNMIESVTTGKALVAGAVRRASQEINSLLPRK